MPRRPQPPPQPLARAWLQGGSARTNPALFSTALGQGKGQQLRKLQRPQCFKQTVRGRLAPALLAGPRGCFAHSLLTCSWALEPGIAATLLAQGSCLSQAATGTGALPGSSPSAGTHGAPRELTSSQANEPRSPVDQVPPSHAKPLVPAGHWQSALIKAGDARHLTQDTTLPQQ